MSKKQATDKHLLKILRRPTTLNTQNAYKSHHILNTCLYQKDLVGYSLKRHNKSQNPGSIFALMTKNMRRQKRKAKQKR